MERRCFQRLPLERPCTVRRARPALGIWTGITHNMGRGGALISIPLEAQAPFLEEGDEVIVEMLLEKNKHFEQRCMQCRGPVVDIERDSNTTRRIRVRFDTTAIRPVADRWLSAGGALVS